MALPKRRHSNARTGTRRAHDHLPIPKPGVCSRCRQAKRPHTICPNCGYYRGKAVLSMTEEAAS